MASMVAMEIKALMNLSLTAFDPPRQKEHDLLADHLAELTSLIGEHLWDAESGIFVNKFTTNLSFYRRISPTSFYPMQVGLWIESVASVGDVGLHCSVGGLLLWRAPLPLLVSPLFFPFNSRH
jgi:hypothetical protein